MPPFDECCVLIPASTLEDFPSKLSDADARSLLAGWTVLWHPSLLARTGQLPAWYRADGPPDPLGNRLLVVPAPSIPQLPSGYELRARQTQDGRWFTGNTRAELAERLALPACPPLYGEHRTIEVEDFYAAGYAALQIQIMTRRLRYTSNLDEIHLQKRLITAAKEFLAGHAHAAIDALHDVFDALAEERDHYFSSDPHLIDLTLTSQSTLEALLGQLDALPAADSNPPPAAASGKSSGLLLTPGNLLIDVSVAEAIAGLDDPRAAMLRQWLAEGRVGWAGGGPAAGVCLDAMTLGQAESMLCESHARTARALAAPSVYGRLAGSTPGDLTWVLARLGYCGMIPFDFAAGTGHGDEAKVILHTDASPIEALTAKPIDAASDASFLALAARLGEAIDSGEIATALLVHWPGQSCDSFADLRRLASWSLTLGRFWKLDAYFRDGEHPYHHGNLGAAAANSAELLEDRVARGVVDPISSLTREFRQAVVDETRGVIEGMTALVSVKELPESAAAAVDPASRFAAAIGSRVEPAGGANPPSLLLINPHAVGIRDSVTLDGSAPAPARHLFASSVQRRRATSTVDIPSCGFVVVRGGSRASGSARLLGRSLCTRLLGGSKQRKIAEGERLRNEFLEVVISSELGGIAGVYSGATRGNRFSLRLVRCSAKQASADRPSEMRCERIRVVNSTPAIGCIETCGHITSLDGDSALATFTLRYTLHRGSRMLQIDGQLVPTTPPAGDPWHEYFACRAAVAGDGAIQHLLLRDKVHRARSRRLVAPLGLILDEAERQTLVAAAGLPFHRKVSDRFLDTLLVTQGETAPSFSLSYGFDLPSPVAAARCVIAPPSHVAITDSPGVEIGWIVHAAPKDLLLTSVTAQRRRDSKLAARLRVVQTRSRSCKASIHFFRDLLGAWQLDRSGDDPFNLPLAEQESAVADHPAVATSIATKATRLSCDGDRVSLPMHGHGIADVLVVFQDDLRD